jgi:CheY-like chemotaxis protein
MEDPTILLADDNPANTMIVRSIFETVGLTIASVENGQQAVDAAAERAFDLIFMDVQMPVMDGLTAIGRIRSGEARTGRRPSRIFTLTTNCLPEDVRASFDAGADGHITKPFRIDDLLGALASITPNHR